MTRLRPFTFALVRGDECQEATWYERSRSQALVMAELWAAARGWKIVREGIPA
jgi:hypothetical protein